MSAYFIKRGERVSGPYSRAKLNQLVTDGKLRASDLVSTRSDGGWKPVPGTKRRPEPLAPELPPRRGPQTAVPDIPLQAPKLGRGLLLSSVVISSILLITAAIWSLSPGNTPTTAQISPPPQPTAEVPESAQANGKVEFAEAPTQQSIDTRDVAKPAKLKDVVQPAAGSADPNNKPSTETVVSAQPTDTSKESPAETREPNLEESETKASSNPATDEKHGSDSSKIAATSMPNDHSLKSSAPSTTGNTPTDSHAKPLVLAEFAVANVKPEVELRFNPSRQIQNEIKTRVSAIESRLNEAAIKDALIVVGQIKLEGLPEPVVPQLLMTQCDVLDDGYFVTAVKDRNRPVYFAAHGFEPTEVSLNEIVDGQSAVYLKPIELARIPFDRQRIVTGNLSLRPVASTSIATIRAEPRIAERINSPFFNNEVESTADAKQKGLWNKRFQTVTVPLESDFTFRIPGCSPMHYDIWTSRIGYENQVGVFDGTRLHPENFYSNATSMLDLEFMQSDSHRSAPSRISQVSAGSQILNGEWMQILKENHDAGEVDVTIPDALNLHILDDHQLESSRASTRNWPDAEPKTKSYRLKPEAAYAIATPDRKKWLIFKLHQSDLPDAYTVRPLQVGDLPGAFLADEIIPLQNKLRDADTFSNQYANYLLAGQVVLEDADPTQPPHIFVSDSSRRSYYSDLSVKDGWFCSRSYLRRRVDDDPAPLRIRAYGYHSVEVPVKGHHGTTELLEVTLKPVKKHELSEVQFRITDIDGSPLAETGVVMWFRDARGGHTGFGGSGTHSGDITLQTNKQGVVASPPLATAWYSYSIQSAGYRPQSGDLFVDAGTDAVRQFVLAENKQIQIEFVASMDGTGKFSGRSAVTTLTEGTSLPFTNKSTGKPDYSTGALRTYMVGDYLRFSVSTSSSTRNEPWIVSCGAKMLEDVNDANDYRPKGTTRTQKPICTVGHTYVVRTTEDTHLKFRVLKIVDTSK